MDKKPEPLYGYAFGDIPNNKAGRAFIANVRRYLNRATFTLDLRANGERKKHALAAFDNPRAYDQSLPIGYAQRFRVYLRDSKRSRAIIDQRNRAEWEQTAALRAEITSLKQRLDHANTATALGSLNIEALEREGALDRAKLRNALESYDEEKARNARMAMDNVKLRARIDNLPRIALWIERLRDYIVQLEPKL